MLWWMCCRNNFESHCDIETCEIVVDTQGLNSRVTVLEHVVFLVAIHLVVQYSVCSN